jgi:hypothetical protein
VHVTPVIGGRVYSIGGRLAPQPGAPPVTDAVVVGEFVQNPPMERASLAQCGGN